MWCYLRRYSINFTTPVGGMDLIDVLDKCRACFLTNGIRVVRWLLNGSHIPFIARILEYLLIFTNVCIEPQRQAETGRAFKLRVYETLRTMCTAETKPRDVHIVQLQPVTG